LIYLLVWVVTAGALTLVSLVWVGVHQDDDYRDGEDLAAACIKAVVFSIIWPLSVPVFLGMGLRKVPEVTGSIRERIVERRERKQGGADLHPRKPE